MQKCETPTKPRSFCPPLGAPCCLLNLYSTPVEIIDAAATAAHAAGRREASPLLLRPRSALRTESAAPILLEARVSGPLPLGVCAAEGARVDVHPRRVPNSTRVRGGEGP